MDAKRVKFLIDRMPQPMKDVWSRKHPSPGQTIDEMYKKCLVTKKMWAICIALFVAALAVAVIAALGEWKTLAIIAFCTAVLVLVPLGWFSGDFDDKASMLGKFEQAAEEKGLELDMHLGYFASFERMRQKTREALEKAHEAIRAAEREYEKGFEIIARNQMPLYGRGLLRMADKEILAKQAVYDTMLAQARDFGLVEIATLPADNDAPPSPELAPQGA